jgi:hypothetical protein
MAAAFEAVAAHRQAAAAQRIDTKQLKAVFGCFDHKNSGLQEALNQFTSMTGC